MAARNAAGVPASRPFGVGEAAGAQGVLGEMADRLQQGGEPQVGRARRGSLERQPVGRGGVGVGHAALQPLLVDADGVG